jgi:ketosteroid isomerase-like protein
MRAVVTVAHAAVMTTTQTRTPLDTVQAVYAAFGAGDIPSLLALCAEDVDWSIQVDAPGAEHVPMLKNGRGHGAVLHYFSGVAVMGISQFDLRAFHVDGPVVLVELTIGFTHTTTGRSVTMDEIHRWEIVDGLIARYRPFVDTATLIEAFRP